MDEVYRVCKIALVSLTVPTAWRSIATNDPAIQWLRGELAIVAQLIQGLEPHDS
jgi:hypothetical protein